MPRLEETNFIDLLVGAGVPRENITFIGQYDTAPVEPTEPLKQVELLLKGRSIAVVRDSNNETSSIVIFHPTAKTRSQAKDYEGWDVAISVHDTNGQFTPRVAQRITGSVYESGNDTMIVYTENQS
jgi:hypothetical protein